MQEAQQNVCRNIVHSKLNETLRIRSNRLIMLLRRFAKTLDTPLSIMTPQIKVKVIIQSCCNSLPPASKSAYQKAWGGIKLITRFPQESSNKTWQDYKLCTWFGVEQNSCKCWICEEGQKYPQKFELNISAASGIKKCRWN